MASFSNFAALFFLFLISYHFATFFNSIILSSFSLFSVPFPLISFLLLSFSLPPTFATLVFSALAFTAFHTPLDTLLSSLLLFSSQSQNCRKLATAFPESHSTFVYQSHQSMFFTVFSIGSFLLNVPFIFLTYISLFTQQCLYCYFLLYVNPLQHNIHHHLSY